MDLNEGQYPHVSPLNNKPVKSSKVNMVGKRSSYKSRKIIPHGLMSKVRQHLPKNDVWSRYVTKFIRKTKASAEDNVLIGIDTDLTTQSNAPIKIAEYNLDAAQKVVEEKEKKEMETVSSFDEIEKKIAERIYGNKDRLPTFTELKSDKEWQLATFNTLNAQIDTVIAKRNAVSAYYKYMDAKGSKNESVVAEEANDMEHFKKRIVALERVRDQWSDLAFSTPQPLPAPASKTAQTPKSLYTAPTVTPQASPRSFAKGKRSQIVQKLDESSVSTSPVPPPAPANPDIGQTSVRVVAQSNQEERKGIEATRTPNTPIVNPKSPAVTSQGPTSTNAKGALGTHSNVKLSKPESLAQLLSAANATKTSPVPLASQPSPDTGLKSTAAQLLSATRAKVEANATKTSHVPLASQPSPDTGRIRSLLNAAKARASMTSTGLNKSGGSKHKNNKYRNYKSESNKRNNKKK
jgi:hypothetical protein